MKKIVSIILIVFIIIILCSCSKFSKAGSDADIEEEYILYQKEIGDEIILETFNLIVSSIEEKQYISSYYGSTADAEENAKFILIGVEITNTTDKDFAFSSDLKLIDDKGREFNSYPYTKDNLDNHIDNRKLSPGMKEAGYLVYEVPVDSISYSIYSCKSDSREIFGLPTIN